MSEYLSVADFAKAAGVTKQAVYRRLDTNLKEFVRVEKGKKYVSTEAIALFNVDYSSEENVENIESNGENVDKGLNNDEQRDVESIEQPLNNVNSVADPRDNEISRLLSLLESAQAENHALNERIMTLSLEIAALGKSAQVIAAQASGVPMLNNGEQHGVENVEQKENIVEQQLINDEQAVEKEKANRLPGWLRWIVNRYEA